MISRLDPATTEWLRRVATDPGLSARDVRVYIVLAKELDCGEYRSVKQVWVARQVGTHAATVAKALRCLLDHGYLERRVETGTAHEYRLTPCNTATSHTSSTLTQSVA